jgi:hypothetical protein
MEDGLKVTRFRRQCQRYSDQVCPLVLTDAEYGRIGSWRSNSGDTICTAGRHYDQMMREATNRSSYLAEVVNVRSSSIPWYQRFGDRFRQKPVDQKVFVFWIKQKRATHYGRRKNSVTNGIGFQPGASRHVLVVTRRPVQLFKMRPPSSTLSPPTCFTRVLMTI